MKTIKKGIVFSNDIKRILNGDNSLDFQYDFVIGESVIEDIRKDFKKETDKIFNNTVTIITEDEMLEINNIIIGEYPHCNFR